MLIKKNGSSEFKATRPTVNVRISDIKPNTELSNQQRVKNILTLFIFSKISETLHFVFNHDQLTETRTQQTA